MGICGCFSCVCRSNRRTVSKCHGSRLRPTVLADCHSGGEAFGDMASRANSRACSGTVFGDGVGLVADTSIADPVIDGGVARAVSQRSGVCACVVGCCRDGGGHIGRSGQERGRGGRVKCHGGPWGSDSARRCVRETVAILVVIGIAIAVVEFERVSCGDTNSGTEDTKDGKQ